MAKSCVISTRCVAIERKRTGGGIVFSACEVIERVKTNPGVLGAGCVGVKRECTHGGIPVTSCVVRERLLALERIIIPSTTIATFCARRWQRDKRHHDGKTWEDEECIETAQNQAPQQVRV